MRSPTAHQAGMPTDVDARLWRRVRGWPEQARSRGARSSLEVVGHGAPALTHSVAESAGPCADQDLKGTFPAPLRSLRRGDRHGPTPVASGDALLFVCAGMGRRNASRTLSVARAVPPTVGYGGTVTRAAVDQANFAVAYDGEALRDHRMSVRDLAPALLGLADVFQAAHETLSPGEPPVSLEIRATDEGSFLVELSLIHEQIVDALVSPDSLAAGTLIVFITGGAGLFNFVRKRMRATEESQLPDGTVRLLMPDGTYMEFPPEVLALTRQPTIRQGVQSVIAPLSREGIDTLDMRESAHAEPWVTITEDDVPAITAVVTDDEPRTLLIDQQYDQLLTINAPNFDPDKKWKVSDGPGWFWVSMEDPAFRARVERREVVFGKGDRMLARVWLRQWEDDAGEIHTERAVVRVDRYIAARSGAQGRLFGDAENDEQADDTRDS